jgi:hypothetical protein
VNAITIDHCRFERDRRLCRRLVRAEEEPHITLEIPCNDGGGQRPDRISPY